MFGSYRFERHLGLRGYRWGWALFSLHWKDVWLLMWEQPQRNRNNLFHHWGYKKNSNHQPGCLSDWHKFRWRSPRQFPSPLTMIAQLPMDPMLQTVVECVNMSHILTAKTLYYECPQYVYRCKILYYLHLQLSYFRPLPSEWMLISFSISGMSPFYFVSQ
jgi:hypothetical protein